MAKFQITKPSGEIFEIEAPDNATEQQVLDYVKQNEPKPFKVGAEGLPDAVKEVSKNFSAPAKFAVGAKAFVDDAALRLKQLAKDSNLPLDVLRRKVLPAGVMDGGLDQEDVNTIKANRALIEASPAALAGNITANLAATALPAARLEAGMANLAVKAPTAVRASAPTATAAGIGAGTAAATMPVLEGESGAKNAAWAAGGGATGNLLGRAAARIVSPSKRTVTPAERAASQTSPEVAKRVQHVDDLNKMLDEGVMPSPGQSAGADSLVGRTEQAAQSIPIVGSVVRGGRQRAVEEMNQAALQRSSGGVPVRQIGHAGVDAMEDALGQAYDEILARIPRVQVDRMFAGNVTNVINDQAALLAPQQRQILVDFIKTKILAQGQGGGALTGELAKKIDSELGAAARSYRSSSMASERDLGQAMQAVQRAFRDLIERNAPNPADAAALKHLNGLYSNFLRVQRAAGMQGAEKSGGVFSPGQLNAQVRAMDPSKDKRAFAAGRAPMQDLSGPAVRILGDTLPDSGTAGRALTALGLGGAAANEYYGGPGYLSALAVAPALYSRTGSRYFAGAIPGQQAAARGARAAIPGLERATAQLFAERARPAQR